VGACGHSHCSWLNSIAARCACVFGETIEVCKNRQNEDNTSSHRDHHHHRRHRETEHLKKAEHVCRTVTRPLFFRQVGSRERLIGWISYRVLSILNKSNLKCDAIVSVHAFRLNPSIRRQTKCHRRSKNDSPKQPAVYDLIYHLALLLFCAQT
jgi:hypothetical protein